MRNMKANGTTRGIRFKSARTRGDEMFNILFEDIEIMNTPFVFELTMDWNPEYRYTSLADEFESVKIPERWKTLLLGNASKRKRSL